MSSESSALFGDLLAVLLDESRFLKLAKESGLEVEKERFLLYKNLGCISPVHSNAGLEVYSPFQLYTLYLIEESLRRALSKVKTDQLISVEELVQHNREWITDRIAGMEAMLAFAHRLEPVYFNHFTATEYFYRLLGVQPRSANIPVDDWSKKLRDAEIASGEMAKLGLTVDELERWCAKLEWAAHDIDPVEKWYHLIQNIRKDDYQKIRQLKGSAALAQHLYRLEEILRGALGDITGKKYLNPHDSRDGSGGSWRIARLPGETDPVLCKVCTKNPVEMQSLDSRLQQEFVCRDCLRNYIEVLLDAPVNPEKGKFSSEANKKPKLPNIPSQAPWLCKCGKVLLKSLHDSLGIDNPPNGGLLIFEVPYGKLRLHRKCVCGEVNRRDIQMGFDVS